MPDETLDGFKAWLASDAGKPYRMPEQHGPCYGCENCDEMRLRRLGVLAFQKEQEARRA
jgi:hypothetical protein